MDVIVRVVIRGRVQGVGFRAWTEGIAAERELEGWVRNRRDGSVEAVFGGTQTAVLAMLELCRQGPPSARVDVLDRSDGRPADLALRSAGQAFSVLATA
ncbi:MAG: acylphosphatase [Xanthobacteraceae bacterium]|jgi:acylphosphatase